MSHEEMQENLNEEFPDEVVTQKDAGHGTMVDFVPWHQYVRRLNNLAPGQWDARVSKLETAGGKLLMVVNVTIKGATRTGTGTAKADKDKWGGAHSEAFSQAFRRACAMHGLGLYFYGKEEPTGGSHPTSGGRKTGSSKSTGPGDPTEKQLTRIQQLLDSGHFTDAERTAVREDIKEDYSKPNAGKLIRQLKGTYKERAGHEFQPPTEEE